jgi:hypothetical protein
MPPVKKPIDATDMPAHQRPGFVMPSYGEVERPAEDLAVVDGPLADDYATALKDAEDVLTIEVLATDNDLADPLPITWVNGRIQVLPRGVPVQVKRKFVEVLARARPEAIKTTEFINHEGARDIRIDRHSALKYPFTVLHDPNAKKYGPAWLRKLIAEPA